MFAMGLTGGIFGIISGIIVIFVGGVGHAIGASGAQYVGSLGFLAIFLSILGIVGAALSNAKPKLAGTFMVIAGIGGFISVSMAYILSAVLLIIGGFMGLFKKTDKATPTESA
ncbi:hypothetical protein Sneaky_31 [Paenibacillus phage Sneaky]|nr:protein of unknown function DUF4064 [Paenibacillus phage Bohemia]QVV20091.1 hypothetical protein Pahemo_31 [Paenibacillus phage Pahemo]QVV20295.1 hypothetical protein Sneaky_31 [Paenibacillus phage Sneaky]